MADDNNSDDDRERRYRMAMPRRSSYQAISGDDFRSIQDESAAAAGAPRGALMRQAMELAGHGDMGALEALLQANPSFDVDGGNRRGWRLIHIAAEAGHLHLVQFLIQAGANADLKDARGWSALMLAASRDHCTVVRALLLHGVTGSAHMAIRVAAANGALHSLHALLASDAGRSDGRRACLSRLCPVRLAAQRQRSAALQVLIMAGYPYDCLRPGARRDPALSATIEHARRARHVLQHGVSGIVVSALSDEQGAMKVHVELGWPQVVVRRCRGRTMLMRKRRRPVLARYGYDECLRVMSHDALVISQLTVKIDVDSRIRGDHIATALQYRQASLSESWAIVTEARSLTQTLKNRLGDLVAARRRNQRDIVEIVADVSDGDLVATETLLAQLQPLVQERLVMRDEITALFHRTENARRLADSVVAVLELTRRLAHVEQQRPYGPKEPDRSNGEVVIGKQGRIQRELHAVYQARLQLESISGTLGKLVGKFANPIDLQIPLDTTIAPNDAGGRRPAVPAPPALSAGNARARSDDVVSSTAKQFQPGACIRCGQKRASVALSSCRHVGLCRACGHDRQSRSRTRCTLCHSQVDDILLSAIADKRPPTPTQPLPA